MLKAESTNMGEAHFVSIMEPYFSQILPIRRFIELEKPMKTLNLLPPIPTIQDTLTTSSITQGKILLAYGKLIVNQDR